MPLNFRPASPAWRTFAALSCAALVQSATALADATERAGRYLDRSVLVYEAAQLNPLQQVADIEIGSRMTIAEALRLALAGTGYLLLDPEDHPDPESRNLLQGRIAIPHESFNGKRVDSVIAALVGAGRGYHLEVDHVARRIRIVPHRPIVLQHPASPSPPVASVPRVRSYLLHPHEGQK